MCHKSFNHIIIIYNKYIIPLKKYIPGIAILKYQYNFEDKSSLTNKGFFKVR